MSHGDHCTVLIHYFTLSSSFFSSQHSAVNGAVDFFPRQDSMLKTGSESVHERKSRLRPGRGISMRQKKLYVVISTLLPIGTALEV